MQKFYDHFFAINIFIEIKDIGLDCFFAGIVDSWLGSDVGNRFRVYDNQKNFIGIYQLQEKKMLKPYKLFL